MPNNSKTSWTWASCKGKKQLQSSSIRLSSANDITFEKVVKNTNTAIEKHKRIANSSRSIFRMKQHLSKLHYLLYSESRTVSCIKFIGKFRPRNPLYPLINNRVVPISTSVCLRSGSSSRSMAARTERFSNFVSVKYQSCQ